MALTDQPYLPLFVDDWMNNSKLKLCSPGAHGLMVSIMCLMHKSEQYGIILLRQKYKQTDKQILNFASQVAKQTSFDLLDVQAYLTELIDEKVLCLEGDQLMSLRMIKDAKTSLERSKSGKIGGDQTKKFAQAKPQANGQANTGIENETINTIFNSKIAKILNKPYEAGEDRGLSGTGQDIDALVKQLKSAKWDETKIEAQAKAMKAVYASQKWGFPSNYITILISLTENDWIARLKELDPEQQEKIKQNGKQHRIEPDLIGSSSPGSLD